MEWIEGLQICLKGDPTESGVATGRTRQRGDTVMVQARFGSGPMGWYPDFELEIVAAINHGDADIIRQGRYGHAAALRRTLTHIQLSGRLANLVYSMDTTNTDFYAHQYKPVLSFLESPSNGILIADEVGLGKTIEAGLIWTELRARVEARRLLVVCPKMLCPKWKAELWDRFGVRADIVDATDLVEELRRRRESVPDGRALIASMQGIRPPRGWERATEKSSSRAQLAKLLSDSADDEPLIDLVVIDEAHYLRNPETSTHELGELLRGVSEHAVLLSATPINLRNEDLFSLLNIVDPDSFQYREQFERVLQANAPLVRGRMVALSKSSSASEILTELEGARNHPLLAESQQLEAVLHELESVQGSEKLSDAFRVQLADRIERVNLLGRAVTRTRKTEVTENKVIRDARYQPVPMSLEERQLYDRVTQAIRSYAAEREISDGFLLATPQRQLSSCMYAAARSWRLPTSDDDGEMLYEDFGYSVDDDSRSDFTQFIVDEIAGTINVSELLKNDTKFNTFSAEIKKYFTEHPGEKVVVFSYFRGTLRYLHERLAEINISSVVLMGGMATDKSEVIEKFKNDPSLRVLLSSEVASEGVDLQFSRFLINYDLPWNPMKVEQRIGRIDRLGQAAAKIFIWNLVYDNTIDSRILTRLYQRLNLFEQALGSMEAVIGDEIQSLTRDLLTGKLTPEQEEQRIQQSAMALQKRRISEEELEAKASQLIAHSGYILQKVHAAHEFSRRVTEEDLLVYVRDYLNRFSPGHVIQQLGGDPYEVEIKLPPQTAARFNEFLKSRRQQGASILASGDLISCLFVNKVQRTTGVKEQISQFHPLVRFIGEELKASTDTQSWLVCLRLNRTAKTRVPLIPGVYGFEVQRWVFDGFRIEELMQARVVPLKSMQVMPPDESLDLINAARLEGEDWLEALNDVDADLAAQAIEESGFSLIEDFNRERILKNAENFDRVNFQRDSIKRHLERKIAIEMSRIAALGTVARNRGLVIHAENQIRKLKERFAVQDEQLRLKESPRSRREVVCKGVILIEE